MAKKPLSSLRQGDVVLIEAVVQQGWSPGAGPDEDDSMVVRVGGTYGPHARVEPSKIHGLISRYFAAGEQAKLGDAKVTITAIDEGHAWCRQEDGGRFTVETVALEPIPPAPPEPPAARDPEQPPC